MSMSPAGVKAFKKLEHEYLRTQEWNDVDAFTIVGNFIPVHPQIAHALAMHIADVLNEHKADVDWTDIIVETYRRTFFDRETASKYGTAYIALDDEKVKHFADFIVNSFVIHEAGATNAVILQQPAHTM